MTAAAIKSWRAPDRASVANDLAPLVIGAGVLGVVTVALCILIDLIILMAALNATGVSETGNPWPQWAIALVGLGAIAVSLLMGHWLYGLRRWIGMKGDPADHATAMRKRRAFTIGSMFTYVLLTPCVWLLMVAFANSP